MLTNGFRKIHLDYHNPPYLADLASHYDGEQFAATMKAAEVNTVVVFGKCCHGMSYYPTEAGTRHPSLTFDLLGSMISHLRQVDIRSSVYYCVGWDVEAFDKHPEWRQKNEDGSDCVLPWAVEYGWRPVCMNSPYVEQLIIPQIHEIVSQYAIDGVWFDMVLTSGSRCYCKYCREGMAAIGIDATNPEDVAYFGERVTPLNFIKKMTPIVKSYNENIVIDYNNMVKTGSKANVPYMSNYEIEALPHAWGYLFFPLYARYIRTLGLPFNGLTGRFHKTWADFGGLKNTVQLKYEVATMLASGGQCSIGDQLHPRGALEPAAYKVIGEVFHEVKIREPWCVDAKSIAQIAVLADEDYCTFGMTEPADALLGITKMLIEAHHQFDIVDDEGNFGAYELLVLPESKSLSDRVIQRLSAFCKKGGKLLFIRPRSTAERWNDFLKECAGIIPVQPSSYSVNYIRLMPTLAENIEPMDYVVYGQFDCVLPLEQSTVYAYTVNPYFERSAEHWISHYHAPADKLSEYPSIIGYGNALFLAAPLASSYYQNGNTVFRKIVENSIDKLLSNKWIRSSASSSVQITMTCQSDKRMVHFVNYHSILQGGGREVMEDIVPLFNMEVELYSKKRVHKVTTVPQMDNIPFHQVGTQVKFLLPRLDIHQIVCMEEDAQT
jgi:hypothetical protein